MGDVVLGHAEGALQDQRLEHRGVEVAVGLGLAGQRGVRQRLVLEGQPLGHASGAVEVAERDAGRVRGGSRSSSSIGWESKASSSVRVSLRPLVVVEPGQQAVRGEDRQPGVRERAEEHQHVAVLALAADLLGVDARGLVAVVAVGDQQLAVAQGVLHGRRSRRDRLCARCGSACRRRRWRCRTARRGCAARARARRPARGREEAEDGGEVRAGGAREPQPVLLRPRVRALVRADAARAVVLDANAAEEAVARAGLAVGAGVVLGEGPDRRLAAPAPARPPAARPRRWSARAGRGRPRSRAGGRSRRR